VQLSIIVRKRACDPVRRNLTASKIHAQKSPEIKAERVVETKGRVHSKTN
jgi:hypothetical protein